MGIFAWKKNKLFSHFIDTYLWQQKKMAGIFNFHGILDFIMQHIVLQGKIFPFFCYLDRKGELQ